MLIRYSYLIIIIISSISGQILELIQGGGYSHILCHEDIGDYLNINEGSVNSQIMNCSKTINICIKRATYLCEIPCNFNKKQLFIYVTRYTINKLEKPKFNLTEKKYYNKENQNVTIKVSPNILNVLSTNEIKISLSNNISCQKIIIIINNNSIICQMNLSNIKFNNNEYLNINISLSYGLRCTSQHVGDIRLEKKSYAVNYIIISPIIFIVVVVIIAIFVVIQVKQNNLKAQKLIFDCQQEIEETETCIVESQKKAFLDYQNAVKSFEDFGRLTPLHFLSFKDYTSRLFNVELQKISNECEYANEEAFLSILLNKSMLIDWIENIEKICSSNQRSLISSLLTIVLFQHPNYCLEIIFTLLMKSISRLKNNSEEQLLFRKSEAIIEKLVGNWISLCMYREMKVGEIGRKFFNLYRAIKCKMDTGFVDMFTRKAKYALTLDHLMLTEIEYEILKIKVSVRVQIKLQDSSQKYLNINIETINVDVLSVDSISQVKLKILDKAIMVYAENENLDLTEFEENICIAQTDSSELSLHFVHNLAQMLLADIDHTSSDNLAKTEEYCLVNTMKHYDIKSGMKFLLTSITMNNTKYLYNLDTENKIKKFPIHLQLPTDINVTNIGSKNQNNQKILVKPVKEDLSKEFCLLRLLAIKKSLSPFIDGFFQCLTNWKGTEIFIPSTNSLFEEINESQISDMYANTETVELNLTVVEDQSFIPIYYLFAMLDNIASLLSVTNNNTISLWKSNSFILRFWINLIKNPNFIFSVEPIEPIYDSLTTIASALMEACSVQLCNVNIDSPIVKQLFLEDINNKYSVWWQSFINSKITVNEERIVSVMQEIVKKNDMGNYYDSSLRSLQAISDKILNI